MTKLLRQRVYNKYQGRCAYCGKVIEYKDMQVDHVIPRRQQPYGPAFTKINNNDIFNLNPSCRACNHYKRARNLEDFRRLMLTLHRRIGDIYLCRVAEDYGIICIHPWGGKFYFETLERYREEE